jgi:hypothetical protein
MMEIEKKKTTTATTVRRCVSDENTSAQLVENSLPFVWVGKSFFFRHVTL